MGKVDDIDAAFKELEDPAELEPSAEVKTTITNKKAPKKTAKKADKKKSKKENKRKPAAKAPMPESKLFSQKRPASSFLI